MDSSPTKLPENIFINAWIFMLTFIKYHTSIKHLVPENKVIVVKEVIATTFKGICTLFSYSTINSEQRHWLHCFLMENLCASSKIRRFFFPTDLYSSSFLSHRTSCTVLWSSKVAAILLQVFNLVIWVRSRDTSGKRVWYLYRAFRFLIFEKLLLHIALNDIGCNYGNDKT